MIGRALPWAVPLLMLVVGTNLIAILRGGGGGPFLLAALVPMLCLVVIYARHLLRGIFAAPELAALVALAALSALWSYERPVTIERAVPLLVTSAFALTVGSLLSLRGLLILFGTYATVLVVANLGAVAVLPGAKGIPPWENTWNGIFNHKNGLGAAALMAGIWAAAGAAAATGSMRRVFLGAIVLALILLIQSESRSSQVIALFTAGAWIASRPLPLFRGIWGGAYLFAVAATVLGIWALIASGLLNPVFDLLERKPTLSGRIPMWGLLLPAMQHEFWLGYGYGGFWNPDSWRVLALANDPLLRFIPHYSHNGGVETWLNLGAVGVALLVAGLVRALGSSILCLHRLGRDQGMVWLFLAMMAFVMSNVTESGVLSRADHGWMAFLMVAVRAGILARASGRPERAGLRLPMISGAA